jgi:hypothetical protein
MKMEVAGSPEMLSSFQTKRRHNSEDGNFQVTVVSVISFELKDLFNHSTNSANHLGSLFSVGLYTK